MTTQRRHSWGVAAAAACLLVAVLWVAAFPVVCVSTGEAKPRGLFVSENALPRGHRVLRGDEDDVQRAKFLAAELHASTASPVEFFQGALLQAGADDVERVHYQCPDGRRLASVVGVVRAATKHGSSQQGVVVGARLPNVRNSTVQELRADASVLAVAGVSALRRMPWLACDVLVVLGGGSCTADDAADFESWLTAYKEGSWSLRLRAGALRMAVVFDWPGTAAAASDGVAVIPHGAFGRMPDLDLVTIALQHWGMGGTTVAVSRSGRAPATSYDAALSDMISHWVALGVGHPEPHTPFLARSIDSITVAPLPSTRQPSPRRTTAVVQHWFSGFLLFVEAASSLEERLHASFYLYFLLSPQGFVSVGEYLYAGALSCIAPAIAVIAASKASVRATAIGVAALGVLGVVSVCVSGVTLAGLIGVGVQHAVPVSLCVAHGALVVLVTAMFRDRLGLLAAAALCVAATHTPLGMLNFPFVLGGCLSSFTAMVLAAWRPRQAALRAVGTVVLGLLSPAAVVGGLHWCGFPRGAARLGDVSQVPLTWQHPMWWLIGLHVPVHAVAWAAWLQ